MNLSQLRPWTDLDGNTGFDPGRVEVRIVRLASVGQSIVSALDLFMNLTQLLLESAWASDTSVFMASTLLSVIYGEVVSS
jgi:hypothetical protein